ncbi:6-phosphofructokinase [Gimesia maris DSM 8797]|nr:6-phosphofructokinase [Gimesia maris DSM 8797]
MEPGHTPAHDSGFSPGLYCKNSDQRKRIDL